MTLRDGRSATANHLSLWDLPTKSFWDGYFKALIL